MTVKFFAILRDRAGVAERVMELEAGADVNAVVREIGEQLPAVRVVLERAAAAVNCEYVKGDHVLERWG